MAPVGQGAQDLPGVLFGECVPSGTDGPDEEAGQERDPEDVDRRIGDLTEDLGPGVGGIEEGVVERLARSKGGVYEGRDGDNPGETPAAGPESGSRYVPQPERGWGLAGLPIQPSLQVGRHPLAPMPPYLVTPLEHGTRVVAAPRPKGPAGAHRRAGPATSIARNCQPSAMRAGTSP